MQITATASAVARLRASLGATQSEVAKIAGVDQSRLSRMEKGEVVAPEEIRRVLNALVELGSEDAKGFIRFIDFEWSFIEPPSFWNPERASLEIAEETLAKIEEFLGDDEQPWPLRRQLERRKGDLLRASSFLTRLKHNIAFVGDIGVGKSTAISFVFDLLVPEKAEDRSINRPVLETGAGGTTICEVHIKSGPEFGLSVIPMDEADLTDLVSDFCAAKWATAHRNEGDTFETPAVSREVERAIRNMSGLVRKRTMVESKPTYHDPIHELIRNCQGEDEFRARILGSMNLPERTNTEIWYESGTRKHPSEWMRETFRAVNNGRMADVPLPRSIALIVPDFGKAFGEFEITVVDTKGVDDVAVREDLDHRLKDPRTSVVLCSRFNDAPGTSAKALLQHMKQTFSERFDTGKVSILSLPRSGEAREMKDDMGDQALSDEEGYEFKKMQVSGELDAEEMSGVSVLFFNVEMDKASQVREELFGQLERMRTTVSERLFDLCAAATEIIENHEQHAVTAAIEEVARRLNTFLRGNGKLGARERHAYEEALSTVRGVRYASTLWAATRRSGEYYGLNIVHQVGVGSARDARLRSRDWFAKIEGHVNELTADEDLTLAKHSIEQIGAVADASRRAFLEGAQQIAMEIYRAPLTQDPVWSDCSSEWGRGPGFKGRVESHLQAWFDDTRPELKETLDERLNALWERSVIAPLMQLTEEHEPEDGSDPERENVLAFPSAASA
ncbi:helix-turn-helix domain-containing protein [Roseovarius indicus]|uniref:Putative zinc finger/helix-turn-helix protein, YgiT family n=1 Tax=Roseovarius indicus TaxID=540747 RepID=A0A0T5NSZ5_9RHOB|nr:helix-turn-helix transcriptional regulator [Roseovarius indicus]KRS12066.1 XRE family transcriptional regulator [Roseovarius indicus]QEW27916.1 putative zinc finger/helix-turn-helix protein, YgiT family [Roseovarius indicus]SFE86210.1 Helix-turn-helix domain-containing protein [Roseovarius indicus]